MRLAGPLGVTLAGDVTTVDFNLNDPKLALGARAKVALTPQQTVLTDARVTAGKGRIDLTGVFRHDAHSSYDAKATLTAFDPLLLAAMSAPKAGRQGARQGRESAGPRGETRVSGTLTASGAFAPQVSTKATFKLGDSLYDGVPLTGAGVVQLAGSRILPSNANLSIAGNHVDLRGSFGAPGDRLRFVVDAPQLDRLGFGVQCRRRAT